MSDFSRFGQIQPKRIQFEPKSTTKVVGCTFLIPAGLSGGAQKVVVPSRNSGTKTSGCHRPLCCLLLRRPPFAFKGRRAAFDVRRSSLNVVQDWLFIVHRSSFLRSCSLLPPRRQSHQLLRVFELARQLKLAHRHQPPLLPRYRLRHRRRLPLPHCHRRRRALQLVCRLTFNARPGPALAPNLHTCPTSDTHPRPTSRPTPPATSHSCPASRVTSSSDSP